MIPESHWVSIKLNEFEGMIGKLMTRIENLENKNKELEARVEWNKENLMMNNG